MMRHRVVQHSALTHIFNSRYLSKRNGKRVLWLFFLIGFSIPSVTPSFAQTKVLIKDAFFEIDAKKAIDSLYNRNTGAAQEFLEPWREKHPDHPLWLLWDGMEVWWNVLEDLNDRSLDQEFIARMRQADYEAGKVLRSEPGHPDALIIRSVANGYIARETNARNLEFKTATNTERIGMIS